MRRALIGLAFATAAAGWAAGCADGTPQGSDHHSVIVDADGGSRDASPPPDGGEPADAAAGDDGGAASPDGGSPPEDGGSPPEDGGSPPEDGGSPPEDGGSPPEDGGSAPEDGGPGPVDGGPPPADAGPARDAGTPASDGGLEPYDETCTGSTEADRCWQEWLKLVDTPVFTPVQRGELGAGPWPTTPLVSLGAGEGIGDDILYAGTDTGQNVYAVSASALYVRRAGAAAFERYPRATSGLRDYNFMSVAGARPGVAYVGYEGVFGVDAETDPPELRRSGDMQRITLRPGGGFDVVSYDTHNSNTPISGKYDHSRSMFNLVVPRRGPAAGEVFMGTEHGVVRYQGELYADHVHVMAWVDDGYRAGATQALAVRDDGRFWYANDFMFGGKDWTPRRLEWLEGRWLFPGFAYGVEADRDYFRGAGFDSQGNVWLGSKGNGVVHLVFTGRRMELTREAAPDTDIRDLLVDVDDAVIMGTGSGVWRRDPASGEWSRMPGLGVKVRDLYLDDTVSPRALYVSHPGGLLVWRGP